VSSEQSAQPPAPAPSTPKTNWKRRIIAVLAGFVALVLLVLFARAFLPRWWAQRIGRQVNGHFSGGVAWGLFYGFLFTFIPVIVIRQVVRKRFNWPVRVVIIVVAVLLLAPNLLTLSVVLGNGSAAHAGQRIMDVDAPAFRGATLVGAIIGVALALLAIYGMASRRKRSAELKQLRAREREREAAEQAQQKAEGDEPT
jgi:signal transduction histidine kinase